MRYLLLDQVNICFSHHKSYRRHGSHMVFFLWQRGSGDDLRSPFPLRLARSSRLWSCPVRSFKSQPVLVWYVGLERGHSRRLNFPYIEGRSKKKPGCGCLPALRHLVPCFLFLRKKPNSVALEYYFELDAQPLVWNRDQENPLHQYT